MAYTRLAAVKLAGQVRIHPGILAMADLVRACEDALTNPTPDPNIVPVKLLTTYRMDMWYDATTLLEPTATREFIWRVSPTSSSIYLINDDYAGVLADAKVSYPADSLFYHFDGDTLRLIEVDVMIVFWAASRDLMWPNHEQMFSINFADQTGMVRPYGREDLVNFLDKIVFPTRVSVTSKHNMSIVLQHETDVIERPAWPNGRGGWTVTVYGTAGDMLERMVFVHQSSANSVYINALDRWNMFAL